jgi:hypothetical protein
MIGARPRPPRHQASPHHNELAVGGSPRGESRSRSRSPNVHEHKKTSGRANDPAGRSHRQWLTDIATNGMKEGNFKHAFGEAEVAEATAITEETIARGATLYVDLRHLGWVSIDNDDTRDIDQLSAIEEHQDGSVTLHVAIADMDEAIVRDGALDQHAVANTTSIYTPSIVFTMFPERLCYDLTSLRPDTDRPAVVVSVRFADAQASEVVEERIVLARVTNRAKLAYNSVSAWLDGGALPPALAGHDDLQHSVRVQVCLFYSCLPFPSSSAHLILAPRPFSRADSRMASRRACCYSVATTARWSSTVPRRKLSLKATPLWPCAPPTTRGHRRSSRTS